MGILVLKCCPAPGERIGSDQEPDLLERVSVFFYPRVTISFIVPCSFKQSNSLYSFSWLDIVEVNRSSKVDTVRDHRCSAIITLCMDKPSLLSQAPHLHNDRQPHPLAKTSQYHSGTVPVLTVRTHSLPRPKQMPHGIYSAIPEKYFPD